jgi:hypothetical protein
VLNRVWDMVAPRLRARKTVPIKFTLDEATRLFRYRNSLFGIPPTAPDRFTSYLSSGDSNRLAVRPGRLPELHLEPPPQAGQLRAVAFEVRVSKIESVASNGLRARLPAMPVHDLWAFSKDHARVVLLSHSLWSAKTLGSGTFRGAGNPSSPITIWRSLGAERYQSKC